MVDESCIEELGIPLRERDELDSTVSTQLRQLPVNIMEELIKRMRSSAVLRMLFIFTSLVAIVNVTVNLTDIIKSNQNISGASAFDKWNVKDSQLNSTNIVNCDKQYDLGFNIRLSYCETEQLGKMVDLRYFLNDKSTIKGIAMPKVVLSRLMDVVKLNYGEN